MDFPVEKTVRKRRSIRTYTEEPVEKEKKEAIKTYIDQLKNPFGKKVNFLYLEREERQEEERLGTYGIIKGAKDYIGTTIKLEPMVLEALGYELEMAILFMADQGIGTCWLGGTFDREGFAQAMKVPEDEIFPIITPFGYASEKRHDKDAEIRKMVQADHRKPWEDLFFDGDFTKILDGNKKDSFAFALEMVRLAPSASNKQPWRIVVKDGQCDFYEYKEPGYSDVLPYDIQRVDMGIAAAHFELAVKEQGMKGYFEEKDPKIVLPKNIEYVFSWIQE